MDAEASFPSLEERLKKFEELFKYRYTDRDPDYRVVVERSGDGPIPPPKMENWPPPQQQRRNRRPRDNRDWRSPRRDHYPRQRHYNRDMDYGEELEKYSRSKRCRSNHPSNYQEYQEPVTTAEESSGDKPSQVPPTYPSTNEESDSVINSPPLQTGGKEKPTKEKLQRPGEASTVMSHFVPLSEAAIGLGLAENRVAPSDNDVQAILNYASAAIETHKENAKSSDKQPPGGKGSKQEDIVHVSSHKHESNRRSRKKHKARSQERETQEPVASHPKILLPLDLIEQDDEDEGSTHVQQVSTTKLIIRPPKGMPSEEEQQPVMAAVKKSAKKKKKDKGTDQHQPVRIKLKVQENIAEVVQSS